MGCNLRFVLRLKPAQFRVAQSSRSSLAMKPREAATSRSWLIQEVGWWRCPVFTCYLFQWHTVHFLTIGKAHCTAFGGLASPNGIGGLASPPKKKQLPWYTCRPLWHTGWKSLPCVNSSLLYACPRPSSSVFFKCWNGARGRVVAAMQWNTPEGGGKCRGSRKLAQICPAIF